MKKVVSILIICIVMMFYIVCVADVANKECVDSMIVLKNGDIIEETFITRRDCLVAVMKIVGVTDELEVNVHTYKRFSDCASMDFMYFTNAIAEGIALGTDEAGKHEATYKFKPDRCATYNEALAFIVRCFVPRSESIKKDAIEYGILKTTDSFYDNLDKYITNDEFYILLGRMLEKNAILMLEKM